MTMKTVSKEKVQNWNKVLIASKVNELLKANYSDFEVRSSKYIKTVNNVTILIDENKSFYHRIYVYNSGKVVLNLGSNDQVVIGYIAFDGGLYKWIHAYLLNI